MTHSFIICTGSLVGEEERGGEMDRYRVGMVRDSCVRERWRERGKRER